jgi:hypothetical protein
MSKPYMVVSRVTPPLIRIAERMRRSVWSGRPTRAGRAACVVGVCVIVVGAHQLRAAAHPPVPVERTVGLQRVVDRVRQSLAIPDEVVVIVVDENPRMASVQRMKERRETFELSFDRAFLTTLTDQDIEAIVAHELGHVWIYTHHPYLQTEQLANRIAMRHVPREHLEQVYEKLWGAGVVKGSLATFLGVPERNAPTTARAEPELPRPAVGQ